MAIEGKYRKMYKGIKILSYLFFSSIGSILFIYCGFSIFWIVSMYGYSLRGITSDDVQYAYIPCTLSPIREGQIEHKNSVSNGVPEHFRCFTFFVPDEFYNQILIERKIHIKNIWMQRWSRKLIRVLYSPREFNHTKETQCILKQESEDVFIFNDPHIPVPIRMIFDKKNKSVTFAFQFIT